jgi:hypothetical protein
MNSGYYNQPPYPGVSFPALQPPAPMPDKPARPWPLARVNRWMTNLFIGITVLGVVLAVLASRLVTSPPSTAGMTLDYHSSLTQNSSGPLTWDESGLCQFTSDGYVTTAPDTNHAIRCTLHGGNFQDFTLQVRVVSAADVAIIGFSSERLAIFGEGRFFLYRIDSAGSVVPQYPAAGTSAGSVALHNSALGVSERPNDIVIQVIGQSYSFYANGQLLTTYLADVQESAGPISLGASNGQAIFSKIALYTQS